MIRALIFFAVLAAIAFGIDWLAVRPGEIMLTWQGYEIRTSLLVGIAVFFAAALLVAVIWNIARFFLRLPASLATAARSRRRSRGLAALTHGILAVGAGDEPRAKRYAEEADKLLDGEPLALFLKAQTAQLTGDRAGAEASFRAMLAQPETRLLGLRGLHIEARRRGDAEAAHHFAAEAERIAPLPWAGEAVLAYHAARHDWASALEAVERNAAGKITDPGQANRQRAVLKTAMALEAAEREPETALALAREANRLAPDLVPAAVLTGELMARSGDVRKASRTLEAAWKIASHPDIARAYLGVRPGDSARDRLARAHVLRDLALDHPESLLTVGRAALDARDFDYARKVMAPIFQPQSAFGRPTVRACLLMADIEEAAGVPGRAREWLARASRAARDPVWIADGVISDRWQPVSPVTGRLDAFVWQQPSEQLSAPPPGPFPPVADGEIAEEAHPLIPVAPEPSAAGSTSGAAMPAEGDAEAAERPESPRQLTVLPANGPSIERAAAAIGPPPATRREPSGRAVVFPLPTAPDDPGPQSRPTLRRAGGGPTA